MVQIQVSVQERYQAALAALVAKLEQDQYILAAVVYGSLARGEAWEKSDIDLTIIQLLDKAEKWFYVKNDLNYSFLWLMYVVNNLARVEVVLNGEAPGREVIHQALRYNPTFFKAVYTWQTSRSCWIV